MAIRTGQLWPINLFRYFEWTFLRTGVMGLCLVVFSDKHRRVHSE